jgi:hypothetical protein
MLRFSGSVAGTHSAQAMRMPLLTQQLTLSYDQAR